MSDRKRQARRYQSGGVQLHKTNGSGESCMHRLLNRNSACRAYCRSPILAWEDIFEFIVTDGLDLNWTMIFFVASTVGDSHTSATE